MSSGASISFRSLSLLSSSIGSFETASEFFSGEGHPNGEERIKNTRRGDGPYNLDKLLSGRERGGVEGEEGGEASTD